MGLNDVPAGERVKIGFFGRRNAGKSSLVNAVTGQDLSVVSEQKGTTTDAVSKSMELLPLGPVVIIDTPGFDDVGSLGEQRIRAARKVLDRVDMAILVTDLQEIENETCEQQLIDMFRKKEIPWLVVHTKSDLQECADKPGRTCTGTPADGGIHGPEKDENTGKPNEICVSALTGDGIYELKEKIAEIGRSVKIHEQPLVRDLLEPGDSVILVLPQDKAAPKGRLILPEQMMIRDVLDAGARALCVQENLLASMLETLSASGEKPALVITDSQVFDVVAKIVPEDIPLTSFSILMARYNGVLETAAGGAAAIDGLKDGDKVLVSEGCTHHRQCGDIGTVKIPALLKKYTGKELTVEASSGHGFPDDPGDYAIVIHCGGCMLGEREMQSRMELCREKGVPYTNYGTAIAYMRGILQRSLKALQELM